MEMVIDAVNGNCLRSLESLTVNKKELWYILLSALRLDTHIEDDGPQVFLSQRACHFLRTKADIIPTHKNLLGTDTLLQRKIAPNNNFTDIYLRINGNFAETFYSWILIYGLNHLPFTLSAKYV